MIINDDLEHLPKIRPNGIMAAEKEIKRFFRGPNEEERRTLVKRLELLSNSNDDNTFLFSADETIKLAFLLPDICKKNVELLETVLPLLDGFWGNSWLEAVKAYVMFYKNDCGFYSNDPEELTLARCLLKEYAGEKEEGDTSPDPVYIHLLRESPRRLADVLVREGVDATLAAMGLGEKGWLNESTLENSGMYRAALRSCFDGTNSVVKQCNLFKRLVEKEKSREELSRKIRLQEFLNQWVAFYAKYEKTQELKYILNFLSGLRAEAGYLMQEYLCFSDEVQQMVDSAMELENGPGIQKRDELIGKLRTVEGLSRERRKVLFSKRDVKLLAFLIPWACRREPSLLKDLLPYVNHFGGSSWRAALKAYIFFYQPNPPFLSSNKADMTLAAKLLDFCDQNGEDFRSRGPRRYLNLLRNGEFYLASEILHNGIRKAVEDTGLLGSDWLNWDEIENSRLYQEAVRCYYKRAYRYDDQKKMFNRLVELEENREDKNNGAQLREIIDFWVETLVKSEKYEEIKELADFLAIRKQRTDKELHEFLSPSESVRAMAEEAVGEINWQWQPMMRSWNEEYHAAISEDIGLGQCDLVIDNGAEMVVDEVPLAAKETVQTPEPKKGLWRRMGSIVSKFKKVIGF